MTPNDKPKFLEIIMALVATCRAEVSEALLTGYWLGLEDLHLADVQRSAVVAMRTSKFMPTVAELREIAGSGQLTLADRAQKAWVAFESAVMRIGSYRSVCFDDPIVNAVVRSLGGWVGCCQRPESEFDTFLRKDFIAAYQSLAKAGVSEDSAGHLAGDHERINSLRGDTRDKPIAIGVGLPSLPNAVRIPIRADVPLIAAAQTIGAMPQE